jgi:hypothetical protein
MIFSEKLRAVLLLALVFSGVFLSVFAVILVTQSAYSTPSSQVLVI